MQREISISGREKKPVSAARWPFTDENDLSTSLYHSILSSKHSPLLDHYLNDVGSSISPSMASKGSLFSYWPQIQQKQMHQDLMDRHHRIISYLREVAKQAQPLRQENVNLQMANLDLNNRLNLLISTTPFHGVDLGSELDGLRKMCLGAEEGTSESEAMAKIQTSVMDSGRVGDERVSLPKSISVRSSGYLKAVRAGKGGDCVEASNRDKIDNPTQKVYVKGGNKKEQPLELEVYNQGMFKTELCNKWQQTGTCPYGDNCQFAHGIEQLRPVIRHPRYKTEVCCMVLNGVPCPYGHRCHFRHTLTDEEQLTRGMNSVSIEPKNYR